MKKNSSFEAIIVLKKKWKIELFLLKKKFIFFTNKKKIGNFLVKLVS